MERRIRVAAVLVTLGLIVSLVSLLIHHPLAFLLFLVVGVLLILVGVIYYLVALIRVEPVQRPKEVADAKDSMILSRNHPDPFSESTSIDFTLKENRNVILTVYTPQGEEVAVLANGPLDAGAHSVSWNGLDAKNSPAPDGVYFYKLESKEPKSSIVMEMHISR